tara:strand:+ start:9211 stop:9825 length:615 start_codon:yes stop_codon:yes gene_type:complete
VHHIGNSFLKKEFFSRHSTLVAKDLIGHCLIRRFANHQQIYGVIVETEAYSQEEASCHGHKRKTISNKILFNDPGQFYVYKSYGMNYCLNVVTDKSNLASGVLIRSIAISNHNEKIASGPGRLTKFLGVNQSFNGLKISPNNNLWINDQNVLNKNNVIIQTTRIGITKAIDLNWRWYLYSSRSISKREKGDRIPSKETAWIPNP